eukprot:Gb_33525 [translate_table: standard]
MVPLKGVVNTPLSRSNERVAANGNLSKRVQPGRSLREGCPLAPTLFVLVADVHIPTPMYDKNTTFKKYDSVAGQFAVLVAEYLCNFWSQYILVPGHCNAFPVIGRNAASRLQPTTADYLDCKLLIK